MKVGIIDIGSNTIKALCAEGSEGKVKALGQKSVEARLGGDQFNGQPWLLDSKRAKAITAIQELLDFVSRYSPHKLLLVGTSALREAVNQDVFAHELKAKTGHTLRILSEKEEAEFIGAGIAQDPDIPDSLNFTAFDLGGGSLERITHRNGKIVEANSYKLGAVRLTAEICPHNGTLPLSESECLAIRDKVQQTLPETVPSTRVLIGSGGAFTVGRAILLSRLPGNIGLSTRVLLAQNGYKQLTIMDLSQLAQELQAMPLEERSKVPHLPLGRADIMPTALLIVLAVAQIYGAEKWHQSFYNLRFGLAASLLRGEFLEV